MRHKPRTEKDRRYALTAMGKARRQRYDRSAKGRARTRRWRRSWKGRRAIHRYNVSPKGQAKRERSLAKEGTAHPSGRTMAMPVSEGRRLDPAATPGKPECDGRRLSANEFSGVSPGGVQQHEKHAGKCR